MYFEDLTKYNYLLPEVYFDEVFCVGWLSSDFPFKQANQKNLKRYISKLEEIFCGNQHFKATANQMRGVHFCEFCRMEKLEIHCLGKQNFSRLGSCEIWIPSMVENIFYSSPSMIIHYMKAHFYEPPQEFLEAIEQFDIQKKFDAQSICEQLCRKYINLK